MDIKISTFNIENLFTRFDFNGFSDSRSKKYLPPVAQFLGDFADQDGDLSKFGDFKRLLEAASISQDDDKRQHSALAMAAVDAEIYCLQEVDSALALERFRDAYFKKASPDYYPQIILHEGNDRRGIDVAALSREIRPLMSKSHAWYTPSWLGNKTIRDAFIAKYPKIKKGIDSRQRIFRRDCLELEYRKGAKELTIFNCHFKSMGGGREKSIGTRQLEALTVREIIKRKFPDPASANWVIVGDMNDYRMQIKVSAKIGADGKFKETIKHLNPSQASGLDPLLDNEFSYNVMEMLPENERWTHYYSGDRTKTQLDYVLVSPALKNSIKGKPVIVRSGQPIRVPNTDDIRRYPRIGHDRPKASDHCPVQVTIKI